MWKIFVWTWQQHLTGEEELRLDLATVPDTKGGTPSGPDNSTWHERRISIWTWQQYLTGEEELHLDIVLLLVWLGLPGLQVLQLAFLRLKFRFAVVAKDIFQVFDIASKVHNYSRYKPFTV